MKDKPEVKFNGGAIMVVELNDTSKMKDLIIVKQPLQSQGIGITEMIRGDIQCLEG